MEEKEAEKEKEKRITSNAEMDTNGNTQQVAYGNSTEYSQAQTCDTTRK